MQEIRNRREFYIKEKTAVTLGKFDGIHRGHRELIDAVLRQREKGLKTVVFTFSMPQLAKAGKERLFITTYEEKRKILEELGVDYLVEYPFTDDVKNMRAGEFIEKVLVKMTSAVYVAAGEDFRFGFEREGDAKLLKEYSLKCGYEAEIFRKLSYTCIDSTTDVISSTWIRKLLIKGCMEDVNNMLVRPYCIAGTVIHGRALGHTIGFATMNIRPDASKELPPRGVYFCIAKMPEGEFAGMANLGLRPTVEKDISKSDLLLEVHLLQYKGSAYGREIEVALLHFERPEIHFDDLEALRQQLSGDRDRCKCYFEMRESSGKEKKL